MTTQATPVHPTMAETSQPSAVQPASVPVANGQSKKDPPPLPLAAFESADLEQEAIQLAIQAAKAAEAGKASGGRAVKHAKGRGPIGASERTKGEDRKSSPVRVQVNERGRVAGADKPLEGTLTDISLTGAFLASNRTLSPGSEVTLRFALPIGEDGGMEKVEARAEVRHRGRDNSGVGLRFLRMPADAMATIQRFLDENRPR